MTKQGSLGIVVTVAGLVLTVACDQTLRAGKVGNKTDAPNPDGTCPSGLTACGKDAFARCLDLQTDREHCGACDNACLLGIACAAGVCQQAACSGPLSLTPGPVASQTTQVLTRYTSADMNGDNKPDLVEWSDSGAIRILLGNGDGSFSPGYLYPAWAAANGYVMDQFVVVGDFNEDGRPDLAVAVPGRADAVDVWFGNGDGSLQVRQPRAGQPMSNLFVGDVNRDGHLDLVLSNGDNDGIAVLLGRGNGTFNKSGDFSAGEQAVEVVIRDWDGDGTPDLLTMSSTLHVLLGIGNGKFAKQLDCGIAIDLRETVIADFNQDGKQDVAAFFIPGQWISVMLGDGRCGFTPRKDYATSAMPILLVGGDVTGDGILDLVEVDTDDIQSHMLTLVGNGDGTFTPSVQLTGPRSAGDIVIGDFNGDGRADVLVSDDQGVHVELNTCK